MKNIQLGAEGEGVDRDVDDSLEEWEEMCQKNQEIVHPAARAATQGRQRYPEERQGEYR